MRFLLAALHPPGGRQPIGGVQSWCSTVARSLLSEGHEVEFWGPELSPPEGRFDAGILAHCKNTAWAVDICERVLWVSHGIVSDERPPTSGCAFTSEEIRDHWNGDGAIVRQPIDLGYWESAGLERDALVFFSYRASGTLGLERTAKRLGLEFIWLRNATQDEARRELQRAAVVFASGRAALEAMACEAPTIICDHRAYNGGALCQPDLFRAMRTNYSGRGGVDPAKLDLCQLVKKTMAFANPRGFVEAHHDANAITNQLKSLLCLRSSRPPG